MEPVGCLVPFLTIEFDDVWGGVAGAVVVTPVSAVKNLEFAALKPKLAIPLVKGLLIIATAVPVELFQATTSITPAVTAVGVIATILEPLPPAQVVDWSADCANSVPFWYKAT